MRRVAKRVIQDQSTGPRLTDAPRQWGKLLAKAKAPRRSPADAAGDAATPIESPFDIVINNEAFHRSYVQGSRSGTEFRFTMYVVLASRRWRALVAERLRKIGQSTARWEALFSIAYAEGEVTQNRLARRLAIEGPTMVRMIHALEKDALVQRAPSKTHRGAKVILLTDKGREVLGEIDKITRELRERLFSEIGDKDLESGVGILRDVFLRLRDNASWDEG